MGAALDRNALQKCIRDVTVTPKAVNAPVRHVQPSLAASHHNIRYFSKVSAQLKVCLDHRRNRKENTLIFRRPARPCKIAKGTLSGHSHFSQAGQALSPASAVPADSRAR
jgi:hypothetical protein